MAGFSASDDTADDRDAPLNRDVLVVGLGASAGGIKALQQFFAATPANSGMAYIAILHLSPDYESKLAEVLQKATTLPVRAVDKRLAFEPNHVYVVSPNQRLSLSGGFIGVAEITGTQERRVPVDLFFRALGEAQGTYSAAVILSGTGANGSTGLKRVKERGGICIAQDPAEADFSDMPRNAIATGLIDAVLPVAKIPQRLAVYRRHLNPTVTRSLQLEDGNRALVEIFAQLRLRTGHDFANYKRSTVMRRIARRMSVHDFVQLRTYADYLKENREEADALLKDLLIRLTNFFRDPDAYAVLERHIIPKLFAERRAGDQVRVWVAGCATGEEAYSVAMVLAELAPDPVGAPAVQIFATDIDERALAHARAGLYTLNDTVDVSLDRLRRFFVKEGDGFRVRRELREMLLFAAHNVIKDPPFSHLDLITCRNLLIYLNRAAQERVLRLFHFGLNPGGYLFLGNSESADENGNLFVAVDKEQHIFQSRSVETPLPPPVVTATPQPLPMPMGASGPEMRLRERLSYQELHQRLLEAYAQPSLVVNQDHEIVHLSERVGRYLVFVGGEPSQNLLKVVRPELRLELHSALYHSAQHRTPTEVIAGPVLIDGKDERVKMTVSPVFGEQDPSRGMILVVFEPVGAATGPSGSAESLGEQAAMAPIARQLEDELTRMKLQLRNTIEHHELQQEELKASNEELQAMNEELRSSSEELETSKEELQSLNEELTTVNQELKIKIDELSQASNDTRNLMNSTDLATVFIDRGMRIKLFTPRARSIFNLMPTDTGRPLLDITHRLRYPELADDIERVLDTLAVGEREVEAVDGNWYIVRVLPYRTAEDRISGVVLTFTDITERKRTEDALRESEERVRLVVESAADFAIFTIDPEGRITSWNTAAQHMFGYRESEVLGRHTRIIYIEEDRAAEVPEKEMKVALEAGRAADERWHQRADETRLFVSGVMTPLRSGGRVVGYTKIARDLTARKQMEEDLRTAREELETHVRERTHELAAANAALVREMEERSQSEELRVRLLRQLVSVQEEERRRISRELHDQLGQEVTALGLRLAEIKRATELTEATRRQIQIMEDIVKALDSDVDFLVWELRPTGLDDLGLSEAVSDYAERWSKYVGLPVETNSQLSSRLRPETETVLYRIVQEALNNIAKHARAKSVKIKLEEAGGMVSLEVTDDGVGFDPGIPPDSSALGLLSMRERAALVGGSASVQSRPGVGTVVSVRVPV